MVALRPQFCSHHFKTGKKNQKKGRQMEQQVKRKPLPRRPDEIPPAEPPRPVRSSKASKLLGAAEETLSSSQRSSQDGGIVLKVQRSGPTSSKCDDVNVDLSSSSSQLLEPLHAKFSVIFGTRNNVTGGRRVSKKEDSSPKPRFVSHEQGKNIVFEKDCKPKESVACETIQYVTTCKTHGCCIQMETDDTLFHMIAPSSNVQAEWLKRLVLLSHLNVSSASSNLTNDPPAPLTAQSPSRISLARVGKSVNRGLQNFLQKTSASSSPLLQARRKSDVHTIEQMTPSAPLTGYDLGMAKRSQGFQPGHPIVMVPGLASSALVVEHSDHNPSWNGTLLWMSLQKLSASKLKRVGRQPNLQRERSDTVRIREGNDFIKHICLGPVRDGMSDPEGISVRPVPGIAGCAYLAKEKILESVSYVMGVLVESLKGLGYVDGVNLFAATYDWRVAIPALEVRDGYFSAFERRLESILSTTGRPAYLLGHSNGNRVIQYFLRWVEGKRGRPWIERHVYGFVAVGAPFLGAPKGLRCLSSGDRMGLEMFLNEEEGLQFIRSCGSIGAILPDGDPETDWRYPWNTTSFIGLDNQQQYLTFTQAIRLGGAPFQLEILHRFYESDPFWNRRRNDKGTGDDDGFDLEREMTLLHSRLAQLPPEKAAQIIAQWKAHLASCESKEEVNHPKYRLQSTAAMPIEKCPCCSRLGLALVLSCTMCAKRFCVNCISKLVCHICGGRDCPFCNTVMEQGSSILSAPPISRMWNVYGINVKTETAFLMKETRNGLDLDTSDSPLFPGYEVSGGIVFETENTPQIGPKGFACSGDGTVPYASLAYPARKWAAHIPELKTVEIPNAEHREILKDPLFLQTVLDIVAEKVDVQSEWKQSQAWAAQDPFENASWQLPYCTTCGVEVESFAVLTCTSCDIPLYHDLVPVTIGLQEGWCYELGPCVPCGALDLASIESRIGNRLVGIKNYELDFFVVDFCLLQIELFGSEDLDASTFSSPDVPAKDARLGWAALILGEFSWFEAKQRALRTRMQYVTLVIAILKMYLKKLDQIDAKKLNLTRTFARLHVHFEWLLEKEAAQAALLPCIFRSAKTFDEALQEFLNLLPQDFEDFPQSDIDSTIPYCVESFDYSSAWPAEFLTSNPSCQHFLATTKDDVVVGAVSLARPNPFAEGVFPCKCMVLSASKGYQRLLIEQSPGKQPSLVKIAEHFPAGVRLSVIEDLLVIDKISEFAKTQLEPQYVVTVKGGEGSMFHGRTRLHLDRNGTASPAAEVAFSSLELKFVSATTSNVWIVIRDDDIEPFSLQSLHSHVKYVICVTPITVDEENVFVVQCSGRKGMKPVRPFIPQNAILSRQDMIQLVMFKCINAVRAVSHLDEVQDELEKQRLHVMSDWSK